MAQTKYRIEKILHEAIRDLPDASKANRAYERGYITLEDALKEIASTIKQERENQTDW